ncbi:hypothetical protein GCM10027035_46480 [Emticicia sediminis]
MDKERLLFIGLEANEINQISNKIDCLLVKCDYLPNIKLVNGDLYVESSYIPNKYLKVDRVIYHGIFEDDFDFITLLALWNGKCLPNALAMMDLRLKHSGLVRALNITRFNSLNRGMSIKPEDWLVSEPTVAKWGNWHCGENKDLFLTNFSTFEPTIFESFVVGDAVRIMIIGNNAWQIKLEGSDWKKSIHDVQSRQMDVDSELLEDAKHIADYFKLDIIGIDYMISNTEEKYLLEVNHIPNVTVFKFINQAFVEHAINWVNK